LGVKITLHCFDYGRGEKKKLLEFCSKVFYYQRSAQKLNLFNTLPYIIKSRDSEFLIQNLLIDEAPILFEGLHSCYFLNDARLAGRHKIVRTHNIEHDYYFKLAEVEKKLFKKIYFKSEARKLKKFERNLVYASVIATISSADTRYYQGLFRNVQYVSAFHPDNKLQIKPGKGDFCLYHGNLSVGENNKAALYLVEEVFSKINVSLVVAGNKPSKELQKAAALNPRVKVIDNFSTGQITELIREAHINVLPTFQPTGVKLKLLSALHNGRFCLVNPVMIKQSKLDKYCIVAENADEMAKVIENLMQKTFDQEEIIKREDLLKGEFSNRVNAERLIRLL
jgi:hypothetical protein